MDELIERLEKAVGPDHELDLILARMVAPGAIAHSSEHLPYTSSVDSALALVERKLPGWAWYVERIAGIDTRPHICEADLWLPAQLGRGGRFRAGAPTAPLAILLALLKALNSDSSNAP